MDTNKNVGINEFSGGMNSDTNYNTLQHNQYIYGENIRLTSNSLINESETPDKKEGAIVPIPKGIQIPTRLINKNGEDIDDIQYSKLLSIKQIDNICVVITKNNDNTWSIYRITFSDQGNIIKEIFKSQEKLDEKNNKFSTVINKEVNGIIKLYIADGEHEIMTININDKFDIENKDKKEDDLISNKYFPKEKLRILNIVSGKLPVGQVQYTYRFYKKYGIKSKLAPLTSKIQVINSTRNKEGGNAEDTTSSIGFQLLVNYDAEEVYPTFDYIQIFRIYYKKVNVDADIELIYDEKITNSGQIKLSDVGRDSLKTYTAEEFSLLDGQDIIPQCIEHNQGYMFAANIKDKTRLNLKNTQFDARSYSANSSGRIRLFDNQDTNYKGDPIVFDIGQRRAQPYNVEKNYTLNKYSDMNVNANPPYVCKYDIDQYLGGSGNNVSWRFITTKIPIQDSETIDNGLPPTGMGSDDEQLYYLKYDNGKIVEEPVQNTTIASMLVDNGIDATAKVTYNDLLISSQLRSLRRDEVYRYGIILYDNNGRQSDVNWIADIKTPTANEFPIVEKVIEGDEPSDINITTVDFDGGFNIAVTRSENSNEKTYTHSFEINSASNVEIGAGQYLYIDESSFVIKPGLQNKSGCTICVYPDSPDHPENFVLFSLPSGESIKLQDLTDQVNKKSLSYGLSRAAEKFKFSISDIVINIINGGVVSESVSVEEYNNNYSSSQHTIQIQAIVNVQFDIRLLNGHVNIFGYRPDPFLPNLVVLSGSIGTSNKKPTKRIEKFYAKPLGIQFNVTIPNDYNILGYQIVRCSKDDQYRKNIMQCITSIPIRQQINNTHFSPYYPHYLLTTFPYDIKNAGYLGYGKNNIYGSLKATDPDDPSENTYNYYTVATDSVPSLFQLYSPEITNRRKDALQIVAGAENIDFFGFVYSEKQSSIVSNIDMSYTIYKDVLHPFDCTNSLYTKSEASCIQYYYEYSNLGENISNLKKIQDVKNPLWEDAYSNIQLGSTSNDKTGITSATKQYKSYVTSIGNKEYLNWVCNAMYDIKGYKTDVNNDQHYDGWALVQKDDLSDYAEDKNWYKIGFNLPDNSTFIKFFTDHQDYTIGEHNDYTKYPLRVPSNSGFVGPGPVCFISDVAMTENVYNTMLYNTPVAVGTAIANIQHKPIQYAGLSNSDKTLDVYYGFGNYKNINYGENATNFINVFDGDVYIVPFEIVQMFKTYDFNSNDTLQSAQFIYYVPIETPINTYFDYGMNYMNTQSKTLQLEPGEISGVASQDRPLSQYNMIFSDNSTSNDVYNAVSNEDDVSEFSNRIWFSNQKISGEYIDNWLIFSPLDYIDSDSRFGDITCLYSVKDSIYCWQDKSFGKISVNERSLVKDTNSNMIQLGTGGVVQRVDYIDTIHGMSKKQFVCENASNNIYWIDDKNKSVLMSDGVNAINLSERANVQSILNDRFDNTGLAIDFDSQSDELLCRCLTGGNQLIFNTKLNLATSVYTREYLDSVRMYNKLYGITNPLGLIQYGGIEKKQNESIKLMPAHIVFVVNDNSSVTKVFDNQEVVFSNIGDNTKQFGSSSQFTFNTNIDESLTESIIEPTFFEGNVRYVVPRIQNAEYGQRMRGKWLKVSMPLDGNSISHVITKFRQSF